MTTQVTTRPYLVQQHQVRVQQKMAGHVESLSLGECEVGHAGVLHLGQAQVLDQGVDLK